MVCQQIQKGDSDKSKVGEWVLAIGNPAIGYDHEGRPQELTSTVTAGIISAKGRDININNNTEAIESFIQTDAVVNPGNSGGALVDAMGRLIGINTAIATTNGRYEGYSFAIPVDLMNKVVEDIIQYGSYKRPYLGVSITELDDELARELNLDISQGIVVKEVTKGGSAQLAGVRANDVITQVNGKTISSVPELQEFVSRVRTGDTIMLTVIRNKKTEKVPVVMKAS